MLLSIIKLQSVPIKKLFCEQKKIRKWIPLNVIVPTLLLVKLNIRECI